MLRKVFDERDEREGRREICGNRLMKIERAIRVAGGVLNIASHEWYVRRRVKKIKNAVRADPVDRALAVRVAT